jgi:hypothetical protein
MHHGSINASIDKKTSIIPRLTTYILSDLDATTPPPHTHAPFFSSSIGGDAQARESYSRDNLGLSQASQQQSVHLTPSSYLLPCALSTRKAKVLGLRL